MSSKTCVLKRMCKAQKGNFMSEMEFFNVELDADLKAGGGKGPVTEKTPFGMVTLFVLCLVNDDWYKRKIDSTATSYWK